eukprot:m.40223 g.40223  ORF g.40223 m.40223 type:complete len:264 (-) comp11699_c0_seq3:1079-1870(-)
MDSRWSQLRKKNCCHCGVYMNHHLSVFYFSLEQPRTVRYVHFKKKKTTKPRIWSVRSCILQLFCWVSTGRRFNKERAVCLVVSKVGLIDYLLLLLKLAVWTLALSLLEDVLSLGGGDGEINAVADIARGGSKAAGAAVSGKVLARLVAFVWPAAATAAVVCGWIGCFLGLPFFRFTTSCGGASAGFVLLETDADARRFFRLGSMIDCNMGSSCAGVGGTLVTGTLAISVSKRFIQSAGDRCLSPLTCAASAISSTACKAAKRV